MVSRRPRGRAPHPDGLTPAEWRLLVCARHGLSRRALADRLQISENAVTYRVANISTELDVSGWTSRVTRRAARLPACSLLGGPR